MEEDQWRSPSANQTGPTFVCCVLQGRMKYYWQGRMKFVDDATALKIVPRCSPSLLPLIVDEVVNLATHRGMERNPKKC